MGESDMIIGNNQNELNSILLSIKDLPIIGNNDSYNMNLLKFAGTVEIISLYAIITEITSLVNMTQVYFDLWDGTNSIPLTSTPGVDFSGAEIFSFFTKNQLASQPLTLLNSDQCRISEPGFNKICSSFLISSKNGVDTYIRFNYTTNSILDFKIELNFCYKKVNNGLLEVA